MKLVHMLYGDRHGGVEDKSGNIWWIATRIEDVSPAEREKCAKAFAANKSCASS